MIREAGTIVGSSSRKLNFTVPTDFEFTEDVANDEIEAKIADNAIRDNHVNAHTSTKITITDKTQLNPNTRIQRRKRMANRCYDVTPYQNKDKYH